MAQRPRLRPAAAVAAALLVLQLIALVPSASGQAIEDEGGITDVTEQVPAGSPVRAEPLTDADRVEVEVPIDPNGVMNPEITELSPGEETKLEDLVGDEVKDPEDSGADYDLYAPDKDTGTHFAILYPDVVNEQNKDGEWVPLPTELTETADGWLLKGENFSVQFPAVIGPRLPVVYTNGDSSISSVPEGVAEVKGEFADNRLAYPGALKGADLVYTVAPGGYKETVVMTDATSIPPLAWSLETVGFELAQTEDGAIDLTREGEVVAQMPAPLVWDSTEEPEPIVGTYALDKGDGRAQTLSLTVDEEWLKTATFPVFVDPGTVTPAASYDTYVKSSAPSSTFGSSSPLWTGPSTGTKYRAFMRFATAWEQTDRVVWDAELHIKNVSEGTPANTLEIKRATWDWNNAMTWNSMIGQSGEGVSATPYVPPGDGAAAAWWIIELRALYQAYADGTYPDYGFRMSSVDQKKFTSFEGTSNQPYMVVNYDTLPNSPVENTPADNRRYDSKGGITLTIDHMPNDPDGDEVLVRYQLTNTAGTWACGQSGVECSAWTDETEWDVPAAALADGGNYYWRVQSGDVCTQPDTLCDTTKPDGSTMAWKTSAERDFTIVMKNYGDDERYAMWSEDAGNGMTLNVNEGNGNLYTEVPIDTLQTPLGRLKIGLSYNSQAAAEGIDKGLGDGWKLYAGPESAGLRMPISLEELTPAPYSGIKLRFRSGGSETYGWRALRTYGQVGSGSGIVKKNADDTFTYRGPDGDVFKFDSTGKLTRARPVATKPKTSLAANPNYRYSYNADGNLIEVRDSLERTVTFDWTLIGTTKRLTGIHTWVNGGDWVIDYLNLPRIRTIRNPEWETVEFLYNSYTLNGDTKTLMNEVRNGYHSQQSNTGWQIDQLPDTAPSGTEFDLFRVRSITPPGGGSSRYWKFDYGSGSGDYMGTTSKTTKVTDPRGTASGTANDFKTIVDFNDSGLPIRMVAPKVDPTNDPDYITTTVWNSWGQVVCSRSPAANAVDERCKASLTDNLTNDLNTSYIYESKEPFRLLETIYPAGATGDPRRQETYEYDEGGTFEGLWVEKFENDSLSGVPDDEALWSNLDQNWGTGPPPGLTSSNNFSLRLSGKLDITGSAAKKYEFRVSGDDGYTLVVGSTVLLNCYYDTTPATNCGQSNPPSKKLWPGERPITIEYRDLSGSANLKVEWQPAGGNWEVIPAANLIPDLGLMTKHVAGPKNQSQNTTRLETRYLYGTDVAKMTRLPVARVTTDMGPTGLTKRTDYTYDDYGRRTQINKYATAAGSVQALTQRFFSDTLSGGSCMDKIIKPEGETTEYTCNKAGDVIETKMTVDEVAFGGNVVQPAQTRVETTTYDQVGRVTQVDQFGPGETKYTYDKSGRITKQEERIDTGSSDNWMTTDFSYVDWPGSGDRTMTEKQEDPATPDVEADRPTIVHTFDWVGNEIAKTDPQTGFAWLSSYDAQNRVVATTTPDPDTLSATIAPLTTSTYYFLTTGPWESSTVVVDPAGVASKTFMDVAGRKTKEQAGTFSAPSTFTGSLAPTFYSYDAVGNVTRVQQSTNPPGGGGAIYSWTENDYNAFGKPTALREPALVGGTPVAQTTEYDYNNDTGKLHNVDGPLTNSATQKDVVEYTWDRSGRLATTQMWTKNAESYTTTLSYDDAGEQVRIVSDLSADASKQQIRDYSYNYAGLLETVTERHGSGSPLGAGGKVTTTNTYGEAGWLVEVDSPRWSAIKDLVFEYDDLGRETARYQDGSPHVDEITMTYLKNGSINQVNRGGTPFTYTYDAANRATKLSGGGSETQWVFRGTSGTGNGLLEQVKIGPVGMGTPWQTTSYDYYGTGQSGGSRGQLKTIDDPFTSGLTTYTYDSAGRMVTRADTAGLTWTRTYESETSNPDTQQIANATKTFAWFNLDYDVAGNVTNRNEKLWAAGTTGPPSTTTGNTGTGPWTYTYDGAGRMLTAAGPNASGTAKTWTYTYDGQGNRLSEADGTTTTTYTTDSQGWPTSADRSGTTNDLTFTHDEVGNLTIVEEAGGTANDLAFGYDAWNLTNSGTKGSTTTSYTLDAFGRTTARGSTSYYYQGASEDLARSVIGGTPTDYLATPGGPMAQSSGGVTQFYVRDLHGDVVGSIAPAAGSLTSSAWYSAFGERTALSGTSPALGFQSQFTDATTGTVDMLTRNYLPSLGRFTSRDVLQGDPNNPPSLNQFVYGAGSPITNDDPLGLCPRHRDCADGENGWEQSWEADESEETSYTTPIADSIDALQSSGASAEDLAAMAAQVIADHPTWGPEAISQWLQERYGPMEPLLGIFWDPNDWKPGTKVWWIMRAYLNRSFTSEALAIAEGQGAQCLARKRGLFACYGATEPFARAGGTTWGNVFMTPYQPADVKETVYKHEAVHSTQWARYGEFMIDLYAWEYISMGGPCNPLEKEAGFKRGGYLSCARGGTVWAP